MHKQFKYFIFILALCSTTVKPVVNTLSANNQMKKVFSKQQYGGKLGLIGIPNDKKKTGANILLKLIKNKAQQGSKKYN